MITAISGGISFALSNFFLSKTSEFGMYSMLQTMIGTFIFSLIFTFIYSNKHLLEFGESPNYNFLQNLTIRRSLATRTYELMIWLDAVVAIFSVLFSVLTFKYCTDANLNPGVITSLFALSSVFLLILAYFTFGEKMTKLHFVGIILMTLCTLVLLAPNKAGLVENYGSQSPFLPVMFAIITSAWFWLRTMLLKMFTVKLKYDPVLFTSHSYLLSGGIITAIFMLLFMARMFGGLNISQINLFLNSEILLINVISGIFNWIGNVLVNHATSHGHAGAASGLSNIQPIVQTILNSFFLSQFPNSSQIVGLVLGVLGSIALSIKL
jgi:drug/metabolite transporter (DMT)-like permease